MRGRLFPTDIDWHSHLVGRPDLDEVNFWLPSGAGVKAETLAPLLFKMKKNDGDAIGGFGLVASVQRMPLHRAWRLFGERNGAGTLDEMRRRVGKYAGGRHGGLAPLEHAIGCVMLASPFVFPRHLWVERPRDWPHNATLGKGYDLNEGEGARVWRDCLAAARTMQLGGQLGENLEVLAATERDNHWHLVATRLGQNTFRSVLLSAYGRCAVSGEHSLPALDAAHILPYAEGGSSTVDNGLILRADIHRLYDDHYVSVTPDYEFWVSDRLREEFDNGRVYYDLARERRSILVPNDPALRPNRDNLSAHFERARLAG